VCEEKKGCEAASLQITLHTCVKLKLFHRQIKSERRLETKRKVSIFSDFFPRKRAEKKPEKEGNKQERSANSRRESYCLQRLVRKSTLFYINEARTF